MQRRMLLLAAGGLAARPAMAQPGWPTRPVTLVVPYAAGGPADAVGRSLAPALQGLLGQPVIVENRPGANGALATGQAARAAPDGYTLLVAASSVLCINPHLARNLPYDALRDFTPLTIAAAAPNVLLANPRFPPRTVPELIAWLRANPGKASYGSGGIGSTEHLGLELFARRTGTQMTHVPYGGSGPATQDLVAGNTDLGFLNISAVRGQIEGGTLRAIAVGSAEPNPLLPGVPTIAETLPGFDVGSWHGVLVPRATPPALVAQIEAAVIAALRQPETGARLARIGFGVVATGGPAMAERITRETAEWGEVVRAIGLGPQ